MKANFYIHGVPKGQDVWGSEQDRDYIKSFYSASCAESVRLVIEIIPAKRRAFYTYIRAKNVFGSENREGAYFGMTVSFDGVYCTDNESLFDLFDTIFNKRIVGYILQNNGGNYRFTLSSFEGKNKEFEILQSEFLKQLESFDEDFESIDNLFTGSANGQIAYYNKSDVDNSSFFEILQKTFKVYISPEYPAKDAQITALIKQLDQEKAKSKKLSDDKTDLEAKLSAATDKNTLYEHQLFEYKAGNKNHYYRYNDDYRTNQDHSRLIVIEVLVILSLLLLMGLTYLTFRPTGLQHLFPKAKISQTENEHIIIHNCFIMVC